MAPLPKPPGTRRRRNAAPASVKLAGPTTPRKTIPKLPGDRGLSPLTRAWWKTVWSSPMAAVYLDADVPALVRLAYLMNDTFVGERAVELSEIRALEDRFGLSPMARRRLQWEVDHAPAQDTPAANLPSDVVDMERFRRVST